MSIKENISVKRGRPREFDENGALDAAMEVFWSRGYEATTMSDLVEAVGLNRASLYGAFGDKEALFLSVLQRYGERFSSRPMAALSEFSDPHEAVTQFFARTVEHLTDDRLPRGCLFANSILEVPNGSARIGRSIAEGVAALEAAFYEVLRRAQIERRITPEADPRALARFFTAAAQGMAVMAKVSSDASLIRDVARTTLQAWPGAPAPALTST